ncbi:MAG: PEP-CTERM sorting domain-containing protein [Gammaproteobacteria bacterium]|nr:PEP-CTERM sorting domain-containing protein [Gammaproteobacteria bacterium]MBQ0838784.1 PEP-CTERM sorting domain-containing protein [Gammaproteobacteria bacterium]
MKHPSTHSTFKTCLQASALAAGLLCSSLSSANLLNGDFSSGFTGWQGVVTESAPMTFNPVDTVVDPLPGGFASNFDASSGAAVLTNDDTYWGVALFQDFTVQSLLDPNNSLWLELDFSASGSSIADLVVAEFVDTNNVLATLDISGGSVDITAWAGQAAEILFLIEDVDFSTGDFLSIDNIRITQHAASVPEPGSLMLLLGAGLGLVASKRKFKV